MEPVAGGGSLRQPLALALVSIFNFLCNVSNSYVPHVIKH